MRWIVVAAGLGLVSPALAQDPEVEPGLAQPVFVSGPTAKDDARYFPKGAPISGTVVLRCVLTAQGTPSDCKLAKEDPLNSGLVAAAMEEVKLFRFKPLDADGKPVAGRTVLLPKSYLAAGDKNPGWLRKPTNDELTSAMPIRAMKERKDGMAVISCQITVEGFLERCSVVSESPEGYGFGAAGLHLARSFAMSPKIRGGVAVPGGTARIPINWRGLSSGVVASKQRVIADPTWSRTPSAAAVKAAYPARARGEPDGQALVRCEFDRQGVTRSCEAISEAPRGVGFGAAARTLANGGFTVKFTEEDAKNLDNYSVDIPFRFRNPTAADNGRLMEPRWIQTLSPQGADLLFPKAAREAGVTAGVGVVDCAATAEGDLTDCRISREEPAAKGFGEAALEAAKVLKMNRWTKGGDPVEGRRLALPIRLQLEDPAAAPAAPKP